MQRICDNMQRPKYSYKRENAFVKHKAFSLFCRTAEFNGKSQPERGKQAYADVSDDIAYPVLSTAPRKKG